YQYFTYPQPRKDYPRRFSKSSSLSGNRQGNFFAKLTSLDAVEDLGLLLDHVKKMQFEFSLAIL
ncbi:hypothetical protein, partial [Nitrosovibrio sp. Nv6]|uniref:hypothetical protein n=1 Tax=Nitrosovibrio sp. Nv6 TaxID=1855340 RepID=UPI0008C110BC